MKRGKQLLITFNSKWNENEQKYDTLKMVEDLLDYVGKNNLYINQIIRWTDCEIKALVEETINHEDFLYDFEGIGNLIKENKQ